MAGVGDGDRRGSGRAARNPERTDRCTSARPSLPRFRRAPRQFTFEFRKLLHLLFVPFTVALCFHSPALKVVCSVLLVWYIVDRLYFTTRM